MDGSLIQAKVNLGFRLAAARTGLPFTLYRPKDATAPVVLANIIATLPAAFSADDYRFRRPQGYAKPVWTCLVDGDSVVVGDYLVEVSPLPGQTLRTFFISSQQPLLPIQAVACNAVVSVARPGPAPTEGFGSVGYGDAAPPTALLTSWPASVLAGTKGERADDGLPRDTRQPWYAVLLPPSAQADIRTDDVITDTDGKRYLVSSVELSALGWRLTAMYSGT